MQINAKDIDISFRTSNQNNHNLCQWDAIIKEIYLFIIKL